VNGFQDTYKCQNCCFLGFAQVFSQLYVQKNCQNGLILKHSYLTVDYAIVCMGTSTIRLRSSLPSLYPLRHSCDELSQAFYRFFVLQVMESWAGPGNEATWGCKVRKYQVYVLQSCGVFLQYHNTWIGELSSSGLHGSKTKKFRRLGVLILHIY